MSRNARMQGHVKENARRVRQANISDCRGLSHVWFQSLALTGRASWEWALHGGPERQRQAVQRQLEAKLSRKQQATAAAHQLPILIEAATQPLPLPVSLLKLGTSPQRQRALLEAKLRRWRHYFCLVVDEGTESGGEVMGYILLSLSQPQAILPPPFPTAAPRRLFIEALAVLPRHHRKGVASALLAAAEKLGRRLRHPSIWLKVDATNQAAQALYSKLGYRIVSSTGSWPVTCQCLMQKPLPLSGRKHGVQGVPSVKSGIGEVLPNGSSSNREMRDQRMSSHAEDGRTFRCSDGEQNNTEGDIDGEEGDPVRQGFSQHVETNTGGSASNMDTKVEVRDGIQKQRKERVYVWGDIEGQ